MLVRRATPQDADAFAAVVAAVAAEDRWIGTEPPVDVAQRAARLRTLLAEGDTLWVLEDDSGAVVGTLGLHATGVEGVAALGMCIVEHARGRGGGHAFMKTALAHARADPALHKVELEVWPDNARAIALYERYGFAVEGLRRDHYRRRDGSLRSSLIMARLLTPRPGT
jgi:RimJ/RimL family protein N-acetyltransferase